MTTSRMRQQWMTYQLLCTPWKHAYIDRLVFFKLIYYCVGSVVARSLVVGQCEGLLIRDGQWIRPYAFIFTEICQRISIFLSINNASIPTIVYIEQRRFLPYQCWWGLQSPFSYQKEAQTIRCFTEEKACKSRYKSLGFNVLDHGGIAESKGHY